MANIIILDEQPDFYIKIESLYNVYAHWVPNVYAICEEIQLYILRQDIPNKINKRHSDNGNLIAEVYFERSYFNTKKMKFKRENINLFIKFKTYSDMVKWKLKNG